LAMQWRKLAAATALAWMAFAAPSFAADPAMTEARQIFNKGAASAPACALCHTLKDAGSTGQIGPNLDELKPDAARIARVIRTGMGPMPAFTTLTEAQVAALAQYVFTATQTKP